MQSTFKTSLILLSTLLACATHVSAASYQPKPQTCRADGGFKIVNSVGSVASLRLGKNYEQGEGVNRDINQAFEWYCNAAMQKNADAQLKTALLLLEGKGIKRDVSKGMYWLNTAANNGSHDAELALGILLVDTDAIRSAVLFKRAAAGGNLYANHRLAELYYYGMGVPQNYRKAQELSELGVAAGFEKSKELLTRIQIKQTSGVFKSQEPVPSVESVALIKQPPALKEESQKSNSLLQSFLAILPSLPNFNTESSTAGGNEVTVITSEASSVSVQQVKQVDVALVNPVIVKPSVVREATVITAAPPIVNVVTLNKSVAENKVVPGKIVTENGGGLSKKEPSLHKELEDQLVKAANKEQGETHSAIANESVNKRIKLTQPAVVVKNSSAVNKSRVVDVIQPTAQKAGSKVSEANITSLVRGSEWVNKQPDMRYAIQLVQASQLSGIVKFIKKHELDDSSYYIHALQDGQYRYILLYGNYPNNRTSKKIAKTLPDAVQKAGYWIRTFGDLRRSYTISP
ncbi:SEL1-like repeat protein [Neptunomonas japonica]|uniref:SEL1-like repeat protein n=1 Tax=Neptunomonas japonica TaxID=417574 RepID=UPI00048AA0CE|nr:SEL1-like repeat protein [Neptunomonas japonica]